LLESLRLGERPAQRTVELLRRVSGGDAGAQAELYEVLRGELRSLAGGMMRDQPAGHTLQPTALVHEAWLRLFGDEAGAFASRAHVLGVAARAMRSILVDHVRAKRAQKRGGGREAQPLDEAVAAIEAASADLLDLSAALEELERDDPELARLVDLRFFAGLSHAELALTLEVSLSTVERSWRLARARLHRRLGRGGEFGLA
jgi:RNA polymerase sigma-70 factor (ECF subfamily)